MKTVSELGRFLLSLPHDVKISIESEDDEGIYRVDATEFRLNPDENEVVISGVIRAEMVSDEQIR